MTVVADSGALYALYDADDAYHAPVRRVIEQERGFVIVNDQGPVKANRRRNQ